MLMRQAGKPLVLKFPQVEANVGIRNLKIDCRFIAHQRERYEKFGIPG